MTARRNILIAGGKTGGHLFPGIAVAQALQKLQPGVQILFAGTNSPFEVSTLKTYGFDHTSISAHPVKGKGIFTKLYGLAMVLVSLCQAMVIILQFKPDFVLGVGGFSSFAVVLAAWILRVPTAIQEQNAIPGITNRMLARFCGTIFTSFPSTRGMAHNPRTQFVGNPVREKGPVQDMDAPWLSDIRPEDFILLVTGGSQGASSINQAVNDMAQDLAGTKDLFIILQTGTADEARIKKAFESLKIRARVQAFFHNMPALLDKADLVICRAGAGTISELALKGVPAVLVPYPHAADDHQRFNARSLADTGAALVLADNKLSGQALGQAVLALKSDPEQRQRMAAAMKQMARPHAADHIAAHILDIKEP
ncbi:MAG: undecaprenyldiphospho-muramoylpentapeptide beta-N-acetylglucosaminyltransferase [Desulfotignum sp.]|jgi:UDP-N-acetylglucosamine--N-acetylmuramyl-(pentapeptide) pyrophosphoryl-undecaprenol N-acetylglucosamine transferase|nr:undecaprenyldiphospho-muramoylpentapeptide beta-N-acetylglucosaminyltransferase [Desulfotignum sp.]